MIEFPKIYSAKVIANKTLEIQFVNGITKFYHFSNFQKKYNIEEFDNQFFFKNFTIENDGHGIIWNDEIDIAESELWINGNLHLC